MHSFYKYNFVPPFQLYARVEMEMKSYFNAGAIDTLMFPIWTEDCIKKFRKTFAPIKQDIICLKEGKSLLPEGCQGIREVWGTYSKTSSPFITGGSFYYPKEYTIITDIPVDDHSQAIEVESYTVTRKTTASSVYEYTLTERLTEGIDFTIEDNILYAPQYHEATLHIIYYGDGKDDEGYQLIPDDFWMQDYIRKYLVYMLYMQIFNQTTDETFNQVAQKMKMAELNMYDAFIKADIESKKQTTGQKIRTIKKSYNRFKPYNL